MDSGGLACIPMGRIPDVEMTEFLYPVLSLWRREEPDTGGAGRHRGGVSGSTAVIPHGAEFPFGIVQATSGKAVSQNNGLSGGHPGNSARSFIARGAGLAAAFAAGKVPVRLEDLGDGLELQQCYENTGMRVDDVFFVQWQGGGGYGDPLHREPDAVARDHRESRVTDHGAAFHYGVVLDGDSNVDGDATRELREQIRRRRQERSTYSGAADAPVLDLTGARRLNDNLVEVSVHGARHVACSRCGRDLGDENSTTLDVARYEGPSTEAGPQITSAADNYVDEPVVFRQLCCPGCWTAVYSGVVPAGHPEHAADVAPLLAGR
jgi:N-methylhydantoinase B